MRFHPDNELAAGLISLGAVAAGAFAILAVKTSRRDTSYLDGRARAKVPKRKRKRTKAAAEELGRVGKGWMTTPLGLVFAGYMARRGSGSAAITIASASVLSYALSVSFDHVLQHRAPPPGRKSPTTPSFPSGHTMHLTTLASTVAYVATREGAVDWRLAAAPGLLAGPLAGVDRLYLDRHWLTDVAAGWLAGISLAAFSAAGYELSRDHRGARRR